MKSRRQIEKEIKDLTKEINKISRISQNNGFSTTDEEGDALARQMELILRRAVLRDVLHGQKPQRS